MAKQAIPEELDSLIQEYLTDGIITPKERQVLLRKAEKLGLDVDEIDLYITAQEQKFEQKTDAAVRMKKGQTCPFCGGSVPQLADTCPHCGQQITAEASEELKEIIENLEDALVELKSTRNFSRDKANVERYVRKANLYYSNNPKIKILVEEVTNDIKATEEKIQKEKNIETAKSGAKIFVVLLPLIAGIALFFMLKAWTDNYSDGMSALLLFGIPILGVAGYCSFRLYSKIF